MGAAGIPSAGDGLLWTPREWLTSYLLRSLQHDDIRDGHAGAAFSEEFVWGGIHEAANIEPYFNRTYPWEGERVSAEDVARVSGILEETGVSRWWDSTIARNDQLAVRYPQDPKRPFPPEEDLAHHLRAWMDAAAVERSASSDWWTPPLGPATIVTTRSLSFAPALSLIGDVDDRGLDEAWVYKASPLSPETRVYEVASGRDWLDLVQLAPVDVTGSRRALWGELGSDARWYLPDWFEVSKRYAAVHLTVNGFLDLAGVPQACPGGFTMITGWGPDETHWLTAPGVTWGGPRVAIRTGESTWTEKVG